MANYALDFDYYASNVPYVDLGLAPSAGSWTLEIKVKYGSVSTSEPNKHLFGNMDFGGLSRLDVYHDIWNGSRVLISDAGGGNTALITGNKHTADTEVLYRIEFINGVSLSLYENDVLTASTALTYTYSAFKNMFAGAAKAGSYRFDGEIDYVSYVDNDTPANNRLYDFNEGSGTALQHGATYINPPANDAQWILLAGGEPAGSTIEAAAAFQCTPLVSMVRQAALGASAGFSVNNDINQGGQANINAVADYALTVATQLAQSREFAASVSIAQQLGLQAGYGAVVPAMVSLGLNSQVQLQVIGQLGALAATQLVSAMQSGVTAILPVSAALQSNQALQGVGGRRVDAVASLMAMHALGSGQDISLETHAGFAVNAGVAAHVVAQLHGEVSFGQVAEQIALAQASLLAHAQLSQNQHMSVTRELALNAGCNLHLHTLASNTGEISATIEFVPPKYGRLITVSVSSRTVTLVPAQRDVTIH